MICGFGGNCLIPHHSHNQIPSACPVPELAQINALPNTQVEAAIGDGDGDAAANQGGFGVGGHVVVAFEGVGVEAFAFADQVVEDGGEVGLDVGVGVFVEGEAGGGVFDEKVE